MEDTLVSYKTALLAKEVGFNSDYVLQCYRKDGNVTLYSKQAHTHYTSVGKIIFEDFACLAPTQSVLQKWLTKVYNIIVIPDLRWSEKTNFITFYCYQVYIIKNKKLIQANIESEIEYNTYEEAFEEGLFEALKLIKNEK